MADISIPAVKTYVLKVSFPCCDSCPRKLEKALMNTSGVYGFKINTKKGLVKVDSIVDLDILKKIIKKKVGKIVEIYNPKRDNKNHGKHQSHVHNSDDSSDDHHHHHGVHDMRSLPRGASGSTSWHAYSQNDLGRNGGLEYDPTMFGNVTNVPVPQPAIARLTYYGEVVPYRSGHYDPVVYNRPPLTAPPLAPHGYYGGRQPWSWPEEPKGN